MKKFTLLIAFTAFTIGLYAQSLSLTFPYGINRNGDTITFSTDINTPIISGANIYVHNNGASDVSVICRKEVVDTIQGTTNSFCWSQCYPDNIYTSSSSMYIAIGDSTDNGGFSGEYNPHGNAGDTYMRYVFYENHNEPNNTSIIVKYHVEPASVSNYTQNPYKLNVSPNPASNQINIDYAFNSSNNTIVIKNLIGGTVYTSNPLNSSGKLSINTTDYTDGIYFATFLSNNVPQSTKKLIIKH